MYVAEIAIKKLSTVILVDDKSGVRKNDINRPVVRKKHIKNLTIAINLGTKWI